MMNENFFESPLNAITPSLASLEDFLDAFAKPFFLKKSIILLPKIVEISNEVIIAAAALNEIYVNKDAPGIWYWFSRNSKK